MKPLPSLDPPAVRALLARLGLETEAGGIDVGLDEQHSNSLATVRFSDGRMMVVKRARYAALATRFDTSSAASRLLLEQTDLLVPRYLELPDRPGEPPLLVYWWIPNPTLAELWEGLSARVRERALRECGRLLRRIHQVRLIGHGSLVDNDRRGGPLDRFLALDLLDRLGPAMEASWPRQLRNLARTHDAFAETLARHPPPPPVLVHNDLFSANVLCEEADNGFHCVGVLDFEDSFAGPVEADLARTEVLHGPLFGRPLARGWFDCVLSGYGGDPSAPLLSLFRIYHLLNLGYHAAATGQRHHARDVGLAIELELDSWADGERHDEVLG